MNDDALKRALRDMPTPEPRPGFVDRAIANATAHAPVNPLRHLVTRWETWFGAAVGGALVAAAILLFARPLPPDASGNSDGVTLALNEARDVEVLINSDRALEGATIRIALSDGISLQGFEDQREIDWQTSLQHGPNVLSLPIVARQAGDGLLVAVIEHDGKTRRMTVRLRVTSSG